MPGSPSKAAGSRTSTPSSSTHKRKPAGSVVGVNHKKLARQDGPKGPGLQFGDMEAVGKADDKAVGKADDKAVGKESADGMGAGGVSADRAMGGELSPDELVKMAEEAEDEAAKRAEEADVKAVGKAVEKGANGANNVSADHHNMSADRVKDNKKGGLTADDRTKMTV